MVISFTTIFISNHLRFWTFEAHGFVASGTLHFVASGNSDYWSLTFFVGAGPAPDRIHVFLEQAVRTVAGFVASHSWVVVQLTTQAIAFLALSASEPSPALQLIDLRTGSGEAKGVLPRMGEHKVIH